MSTTNTIAETNLSILKANSYPGRGLVLGRTQDGAHLVQVYWIMGRSENSRNRVFGCDNGGRLFTEPSDPAKVKDSELIIYNAMRELTAKEGGRDTDYYVVSNGSQTDTVIHAVRTGGDARHALDRLVYEPDEPNYTPRITGIWRQCVSTGQTSALLSLLRRSRWGDACDRQFFCYDLIPAGLGFGVTTYCGDGNPLPPFEGEPLLLPINGDSPTFVAGTFWNALNVENRVSLAVKFIDGTGKSRISLINKYQRKQVES